MILTVIIIGVLFASANAQNVCSNIAGLYTSPTEVPVSMSTVGCKNIYFKLNLSKNSFKLLFV